MTRTTDRGSLATHRPGLRLVRTSAVVLVGSAGLVILATNAAAGEAGPPPASGSTVAAAAGGCLDVTSSADGTLTVVGRGFGAGEQVTLEVVAAGVGGVATDTGGPAPGTPMTAAADGVVVVTVASPADAPDLLLSATGETSGRGCAGRLTGDVYSALPLPTTAGTTATTATTLSTEPSPTPTLTTPTTPSSPEVPLTSATPDTGTPVSSTPATSSTSATSTPVSSTDPVPTPQAQVLAAARAAELAAAGPTAPRAQVAAVATEVLPTPTYPQQSVDPFSDPLGGESASVDTGFAGDGSVSDPFAATSTDPFATIPTETSDQAGAPVTFGQWSVPTLAPVSVTPYVAPAADPAASGTTTGTTTTALANTGVPVAGLAVPGLVLSAGGAALVLMSRRPGARGAGRRH